jgi:prolipoprotein diacylglyceryl transferase
MDFGFILWDVNPEVFHDLANSDSPIRFIGNLRWYGLMFATAFLVGQFLMHKFFRAEGKPVKDIDTLTLFMVLGTVVGARLGHCLFYEPDYFLSHPLEILYIWQGGLASHGASIGILISIWFYSKDRIGQSYLWTLDHIVITVAFAGMLIRIANFVNAEIVGKPTNLGIGTVFAAPMRIAFEERLAQKPSMVKTIATNKDTLINGQHLVGLKYLLYFPTATSNRQSVLFDLQTNANQLIQNYNADEPNIYLGLPAKFSATENNGQIEGSVLVWGIPRHPAQLYEAFSCGLVFILLLLIWNAKREKLREGYLLGIFLIIVFGLRIFYEQLKENQVGFEDKLSLNMGQILSIPCVLLGCWLLYRTTRKANTESN